MKARIILLLFILISGIVETCGQKIHVLNEKDKVIYKFKSGKSIDFRIDYDRLYSTPSDSVLEVRMYSVIDSITPEMLMLSENQVVLHYLNGESQLIEKEYEFTDLVVDINEIKAVTFSPTMESVGRAFMMIGLAAVIVSPIFGLNSGQYSTDRLALVAGMGLATAAIGGTMTFAFKQKPVRIKKFNGPEYFKEYQRGRLSYSE